MSIILAIFSGIASLVNYSFYQQPQSSHSFHFILQIIFFLIAVGSIFFYKGKKTRKDYVTRAYQIFTIRYGLCFLSVLGSFAILCVIFLDISHKV